MEGRLTWTGALHWAFNALVLLFLMVPLIVLALASLNSSQRLLFPPLGLSVRWYAEILGSQQLLGALQVSVWVAGWATLISLVLGTLAAFALDRYDVPGKQALSSFFLSPLLIPGVVLGIAILLFYANLGRGPSLDGLVVAHGLICTPYVIRTVLATLARFDHAVEEAAASLGASGFQVKWLVTLPLIKPGLIAGGFFAFITSFDNVPVSVFLSGARVTTLPVLLFAQIDAHGIEPIYAAVATVLIALTLAAILLLDRYVGLEYLQSGKGD